MGQSGAVHTYPRVAVFQVVTFWERESGKWSTTASCTSKAIRLTHLSMTPLQNTTHQDKRQLQHQQQHHCTPMTTPVHFSRYGGSCSVHRTLAIRLTWPATTTSTQCATCSSHQWQSFRSLTHHSVPTTTFMTAVLCLSFKTSFVSQCTRALWLSDYSCNSVKPLLRAGPAARDPDPASSCY